jgi:hypothetical protein
MKVLDKVKFIKDRAEYRERGVNIGDTGTVLGEERNGYVLVVIEGEIYQNKDGVYCTTDIDIGARVEDLEVVKES